MSILIADNTCALQREETVSQTPQVAPGMEHLGPCRLLTQQKGASTSKETIPEHPLHSDIQPTILVQDQSPKSLRPLTSLNWPYVPDQSAYPDPLERDDPKALQTQQYEAIGIHISLLIALVLLTHSFQRDLPQFVKSWPRIHNFHPSLPASIVFAGKTENEL
jgi:hypothetical protein